MAENQALQQYFDLLDESTALLKESLSSSNVDALSENLNNIANKEVFVENGAPNEETVQKLNDIYKKMSDINLTQTQLKQAITISIIKSQRSDKTEVNKLMTPDTIGLISSVIGYEIIKKLDVKELNIIDPTVGTGNLLIEFIHQLKLAMDINVNAAAIDNDESLLSLTKVFGEVLNINLEAYLQDAIADWPIEDIQLAIADLPVGYYPVDDNAIKFETKSESGHSYAHHLLIEQTMDNLNDDGVGIFIVPSQIFQTEEAKILSSWMVKSVYLQAVLDLPNNLFTSKEAQKSIVVLQKHGDHSKQTPNVLMGTIPDVNNIKEFEEFRKQIKKWSEETF
ncbi:MULTISPECIES: class I SAM-dependent methyltransferase [Lactobacillaceae]|uniref:class I SAM-dependent methyltransferase n=1 Tax=Lactobacillaceae TaxID=33958 RepID=UPI000C1B7AE3|nr:MULTISPECIES: class I SAM-dependent methyltransferase [Lactobacillaceae]